MIIESTNEQNGSDNLLSLPINPSQSQVHVERPEIPYKNLSNKYCLGSTRNSVRQYYEMYAARLDIMRPNVEAAIKKKWGNVPLKRLHELEVGEEVCAIVGTLYKKQELKPSVLKELCEENQLMPQPILEKFTSDDDVLMLEDELQRIQVVGNINVAELVTGIVCGLKGCEQTGGKFVVSDICFAGLPKGETKEVDQTGKCILFASGFELDNKNDSHLPLQLLLDLVAGHLGEPAEQRGIANIVRVVIAGNSISGGHEDVSLNEKVRLSKLFDDHLTELSSLCPVDLMPGDYDPVNYVLPQQPFHHCLFPKASKCSLMQCVTNPYEFELGGRIVIGTSGQNVKNIYQCSSLEDPLEILEKLCQWGHLAPSAPDTLLSYPYKNEEPFVIGSCPDILFAGDQKRLSSKLISGPTKEHLLLSIPKFSSTRTCALVNLTTLEVRPICFGIESEEGYISN